MEKEHLAVHALRVLAIDMIEHAASGHPGMPMGAAPMAYELWTKHMNHNPGNPHWFNRDRFILSAGHGSALLYSLLHLTGYDLPLEELKQFRRWGSKTPGHPEFGHTPGVEATTGPLGQGIAMAVGMAMAEAHLASVFNRDGFAIVNHFTYALCGDGDLMEGISAEAASLAGHLGLGKLIVLYDSNDISLDGELSITFSENVKSRFEACGWQYIKVEDGNDLGQISQALEMAKRDLERPSLIEVKTIIGYGSPNKAGKSAAHGSPLGKQEASLAKETYGWTHEPFHIPEEVRACFQHVKTRGARLEAEWNRMFAEYRQFYPELAERFERTVRGELPADWDAELPVYSADAPPMATREASGIALNAIAAKVPFLFGGSADLASSNNTALQDFGIFRKDYYSGRNVWFGVREHAMGAILNGLSLHGGIRPYGGTFLVFSDYLRPAVRLSALMGQPVIYVFTHDSIAVGEDGPTHQPIEQIPSLRLIPNLIVMRPADANETVQAYRFAVQQTESPVAIILSRQKLPVLPGTEQKAAEGVARGAYVLADPAEGVQPIALLIASGSEVSLALDAHLALQKKGIPTRVVSFPSWERFLCQPQSYQDAVLLPSVKARVAVEMANPQGWERFVGERGAVLGIDHFGASAKGEVLLQEYGFTVDRLVYTVEQVVRRCAEDGGRA
ncbi:transketolase [Brevibacillus marinus]|uniref:transketolase n=1 Tax=Brevibacillus marinus TaxID=2496837 RepID=UPI000F837026|nr:transketolase [Brevibacillus marinus]